MDDQLKNIKKGFRIELDITDLAFGGKGIAKLETEAGNYIVFVPNTIPGQRVRAKVIKKKKSFAECKLMEVLVPSPEEQPISYQSIPGAPYAKWPVERQHEEKKRTTFELYKRIGQFPEIEEIYEGFIASPENWHYRNKMEYSFTDRIYDLETNEERDGFALGFKHRGQWWSVENMDKDSGLFDAQVEDNLKQIREWCIESGMPPWSPKTKDGFFRYLTVRKSFSTNEVLINLTTTSQNKEEFNLEGFIALLQSILGERLAGVLHTLNDSRGDVALNDEVETNLVFGKDRITQDLLGLKFDMSIQSFFQPNPQTAELLYSKAIEYAFDGRDLAADEVIMDLFCGTGTIGQIMASKCSGKKQIIGVDIVAEAIDDAKMNAAKNELSNVEFYAADVGKFLREYPQYNGKIDTLVLDPPRGGIAPKTLKKVIALNAPRIVYVSCNPATQARDSIELREAGYKFKRLTMVDQFPHTSHIETVGLFEK